MGIYSALPLVEWRLESANLHRICLGRHPFQSKKPIHLLEIGTESESFGFLRQLIMDDL